MAGHPPALLRATSLTGDAEWHELKAPGMPIGLFQDAVYEERCISITSPAILFLYTDGIYELTQVDGSLWDHDAAFERSCRISSIQAMQNLAALVRRDPVTQRQIEIFPDDASAISIHFHQSNGATISGRQAMPERYVSCNWPKAQMYSNTLSVPVISSTSFICDAGDRRARRAPASRTFFRQPTRAPNPLLSMNVIC